MAHPQLTIDVIRLPRRRLRDTGRLFRLESRLGRRRLRGFLPEERPRRRRRASRGLRPSARGRIPTNATRQSSRRIATRIASKHRSIARFDRGFHSFIHSFIRSFDVRARRRRRGSRARASHRPHLSRERSHRKRHPSRGARGGEHVDTSSSDADDRGAHVRLSLMGVWSV